MKDSTAKDLDKAKPPAPGRPAREVLVLARRHLRFGWWSFLVFLILGIVLEGLHGFKVGWYLDASRSTRRLMWTLAHAHGALLGLVHIAFGATASFLTGWDARRRGLASASLIGASFLLPGGFFLGGMVIYAGDPGLGILLVPVGALLFLVGVFLTARETASLLPPR
jgi:hypothetical protein